jgi:rhodanese-related sulfurtransferase
MQNILIGSIAVAAFVFTWELFWWALGVKPLLPYHLKNALRKNAGDFCLIDVRTATEYKLFHINGAKNHPELLLHPELFRRQDPSKKLVVICMTGHRSPLAAYRLKRRGSRKVYNLTWGMLGWLLSGGETRR